MIFFIEKENWRTEANRGENKEIKEKKCRTCRYCKKTGRKSQTATAGTIKGESLILLHYVLYQIVLSKQRSRYQCYAFL